MKIDSQFHLFDPLDLVSAFGCEFTETDYDKQFFFTDKKGSTAKFCLAQDGFSFSMEILTDGKVKFTIYSELITGIKILEEFQTIEVSFGVKDAEHICQLTIWPENSANIKISRSD